MVVILNPIRALRAWWHRTEAELIAAERQAYEHSRRAAPSYLVESYRRENHHRDAWRRLTGDQS